MQVFCGPAVEALRRAHFGPGSGPIWMDDVTCTGQENRLEECQFRGWGNHDCNHSEDAGVRCEIGKYRLYSMLGLLYILNNMLKHAWSM